MSQPASPHMPSPLLTAAQTTAPDNQARLDAPRGFALGVFIIALVITLSREPGWLLDPRFWAEEGLVHFVNAFHNTAFDGLIYVNVTGYLALVPNLATVLAAKLLPLELAAYGTLTVSALIHALPALIIASARLPGWSLGQRLALALTTLLIGPSAESWLNTINSQFVLVVIAALLLITEHRQGWWRYGLCLTVPLASPVPAFLAPLFILRACWRRERRAVIEAGCYLLGTLAAASIAVWYSQNHVQTEAVDRLGKDLLPDIIAIAHVLAVKTTGYLLGGDWGSALVYGWLTDLSGAHPVGYGGLALMLAIPPFALGAWAAWRQREARWLFLACGLILTLIMVFAGEGPATQLAPTAGRRYLFPVNVLLMLTLLLGFWPRQPWSVRPVAWAGMGALSAVLAINALAFWFVPLDQQGPSWRAQARAWLDDPTRPVRFWPGVPGNPAAWSARLTPPVTAREPIHVLDDGAVETRVMRWREEPVAIIFDVTDAKGVTLMIRAGTEAAAGPLILATPQWHLSNGSRLPLTVPEPATNTLPHIGTEHFDRAFRLDDVEVLSLAVPEGATRLTLMVGIDYRRPYKDTTAILRLTRSDLP